jgi:hypothetical protein
MKTLLMPVNAVLYAVRRNRRDHYDAHHSGGMVPSY